MTTYTFPPTGKTLYGLTTGTVYKPGEGIIGWEAEGKSIGLFGLAADEPDGVSDVRPLKVGNTISSVEELDALPNGTILRDESGAWEKLNGWFFPAREKDFYTSLDLADNNVLTILWLPAARNADS